MTPWRSWRADSPPRASKAESRISPTEHDVSVKGTAAAKTVDRRETPINLKGIMLGTGGIARVQKYLELEKR